MWDWRRPGPSRVSNEDIPQRETELCPYPAMLAEHQGRHTPQACTHTQPGPERPPASIHTSLEGNRHHHSSTQAPTHGDAETQTRPAAGHKRASKNQRIIRGERHTATSMLCGQPAGTWHVLTPQAPAIQLTRRSSKKVHSTARALPVLHTLRPQRDRKKGATVQHKDTHHQLTGASRETQTPQHTHANTKRRSLGNHMPSTRHPDVHAYTHATQKHGDTHRMCDTHIPPDPQKHRDTYFTNTEKHTPQQQKQACSSHRAHQA